MAVFSLILSKGRDKKEILLGSVHLTPDDPERGEQMLRVAEWISERKDNNAIVMGDFNWGYKRTSGVENYIGEKKIKELHERNEVYQLFYNISYLGKGKDADLRTNMGFIKEGYMYDQFLLTPALAESLADKGEFLSDCGIYAFDLKHKAMSERTKYWTEKRSYGLDKLTKLMKKKDTELSPEAQQAYDDAIKAAKELAKKDATFYLSDHRAIWVQLKVW